MVAAKNPTASWLIALDIDGTLLDETEIINPRVRSAIQEAESRGHRVLLASGRPWETTHPVIKKLNIQPQYVVCCNGAKTMKLSPVSTGDYEIYHVRTFDPTEVLELIREHIPDGRFLVELADGTRLHTDGVKEWNLESSNAVEYHELLCHRVTRVIITIDQYENTSPNNRDKILTMVRGLDLHVVTYAIGTVTWLDVAPEGVNKATALERVRVALSHPRSKVFAAGDGTNDIEMLIWAGAMGRSAAMGHAPAEVRAAATETIRSVRSGGLADALSSLS